MKRYSIIISDNAYSDIQNILDYISTEYQSPLTARRYVAGLYATIDKLANYATSLAVNKSQHILHLYGSGIRRVNYKKVAILYMVDGNYVIIQRILKADLITK